MLRGYKERSDGRGKKKETSEKSNYARRGMRKNIVRKRGR